MRLPLESTTVNNLFQVAINDLTDEVASFLFLTQAVVVEKTLLCFFKDEIICVGKTKWRD